MTGTYGEILSDLVDDMARFEDRPDIFRRNDISRNHFHNVTNPNRESSSGNPYYCPTEWGVKLTRDSKNYKWVRAVAHDCKGMFISLEDIEGLRESNPEKSLKILMRIIGAVKKKK